MKKYFFAAIAILFAPVVSLAQDDVYFTPSKNEVKAKKEARELARALAQEEAERQERNRLDTMISSNYSGLEVPVDEYNRRSRRKKSTQPLSDADIYSKDSIASDVISFTAGAGVYPEDAARVDTVYKYVYVNDEDDYRYSRYMSRWDDYYWWYNGFGPWGWSHPISWYAGWYYPYYDPWFDQWYDPWYSPWHYPYYYGYYGTLYNPYYYGDWRYGYYDYAYYGHPTIIINGGGGHHGNTNHTYAHVGGAPTGSANHAGSRRAFNTGSNHVNNAIARRNGDGVGHGGVRGSQHIAFGGNRQSSSSSYRSYESNRIFEGNRASASSPRSSSSSYGGSSPTSSGSSYGGARSSSYSGGGSSYSGGSSSRSGSSSSGGFGGGGRSGGGSFGGGRR